MIRAAVVVALVGIAVICQSQPVRIIKTDGIIETVIQGRSDTHLFITDNQLEYSQIREVSFAGYDSYKDELYRFLKGKGIGVNHDYKIPVSPVVIQSPDNLAKEAVVNIDQLKNSLDAFRAQRAIGKSMEASGILLSIGAASMQAKYNNDYLAKLATNPSKAPEQKFVPAGVYLIGGIVSTIGFIVDWDAGKHLRIKR